PGDASAPSRWSCIGDQAASARLFQGPARSSEGCSSLSPSVLRFRRDTPSGRLEDSRNASVLPGNLSDRVALLFVNVRETRLRVDNLSIVEGLKTKRPCDHCDGTHPAHLPLDHLDGLVLQRSLADRLQELVFRLGGARRVVVSQRRVEESVEF